MSRSILDKKQAKKMLQKPKKPIKSYKGKDRAAQERQKSQGDRAEY